MTLFLLSLTGRSTAQVYYLTSDGSATTTTAADALNRMNFDGTSMTPLLSPITSSPLLLALDPVNNRAFVYEGLTASRGIKVYSLGGASPTLERTLPVPAQVSAIEYDVTSDYVYFLTTDALAANLSTTDALNRIKADGTGSNQVLISSITTSPLYLALNTANNRAYVYEGLTASRGIKTIDLSNNTVSSMTLPVPAQVVAIDYARTNGYLYYLTTDAIGTSTSVNDALYRVKPDGTDNSVVSSSFTNAPFFMALDLTNDRIYVVDNFSSTPRAFKIVQASTGTVTATLNQSTLFTAVEISQLAAPTVTTGSVSNVATTSAVLGGNVTADGGVKVTERGVVYVTGTGTPTTSNTKVTSGTGTGPFSLSVSSLTAGTTYTIRAYAINSLGTRYGGLQSFTTATALATTGSQTDVSCFGSSTGAASVSVTGGVTPYVFSWQRTSPNPANLPATSSTTNSSISAISAGSYMVSITDGSGSSITRSFTIIQPTALSLTASPTRVSKAGGSDGKASVSISGGTPTYIYDWTPGSPSGDGTSAITSLSAGTYGVSVTDSKGCAASISVVVTTAPDLTSTLYSRPSSTYGTSPMSVVVDITELNSVPTNGTVTVYITKDTKAPLSFSATATSVNNRPVQNSVWSFDGTSNGSFYILTTTQVIPADGVLSVGLRGTVSPGATKGTLALSAIIDDGSGGELKNTNNSDADKINYFAK